MPKIHTKIDGKKNRKADLAKLNAGDKKGVISVCYRRDGQRDLVIYSFMSANVIAVHQQQQN